jgi:aspartate aminotransferase-like enzyme
MARKVGAEVEILEFGYDSVADVDRVREVAQERRPTLITAVHCETPSGTLNCVADIGEICREVDALYYVDYVASAGGTPVNVDEWSIDLGLLGSQKVLSLMPDLAMVSISDRAWARIKEKGYEGYDALSPWHTAIESQYMPYTHNWQAMAGLRIAIDRLIDAGLEESYSRHDECATICRDRLTAMGIELWPVREDICAPTVTAAKVPDGWTWQELDQALRRAGMVVGGSYGPMANKVFRIGHMGSQADITLVETGMDVLASVLADEPPIERTRDRD